MANQLLLYIGDTLVGDINKYAKNKRLVESLKSENSSPQADTFTFSINWIIFQRFIAKFSSEAAANFLKVGKTRIVFVTNGYVRFAGWLASRPARSGAGSQQELALTFYEYFARLAGDLVCADDSKTNPARTYTEVPAHEYVMDMIQLFLTHAAEAGEVIDWDWGVINTLRKKTITYKDFQTIAKALCDAMDNSTGAGKFDVVFRTDPEDYTHQYIDILKPRGAKKNITIRYPADGVYKLWASDFSVEETNEYASEILVAGNGQVGDTEEGEQTAELGVAEDDDFAQEYCYFRTYITKSNLVSQQAVTAAAATELANRAFVKETPKISLVGRPIEWGNASNYDNGLALGDAFYFSEEVDDLADNSGWYRIIKNESSWDDNDVETITPTLLPYEEEGEE